MFVIGVLTGWFHRFCTDISLAAPDVPYKYFGIDNGVTRRCGMAYAHDLEPRRGCYISCSGSSKQRCGGNNRISLWDNEEYFNVRS